MVVNAYGEVNERGEVRGMPGQPDCGPARHHALTHEIFKISDTRERVDGRRGQPTRTPRLRHHRRRRVSSPFASMRNFLLQA